MSDQPMLCSSQRACCSSHMASACMLSLAESDAPSCCAEQLPDGVRDAIDAGRVDLLRDWLTSNGSHIDACDAKGRTALMLAATQGHSVLVQELLAAGASLEAQQSQGTTALMFACFVGETRVVMQLLLASASTTRRDKRHLTAHNYAKLKQHELVIALLHQHEQQPLAWPRLAPQDCCCLLSAEDTADGSLSASFPATTCSVLSSVTFLSDEALTAAQEGDVPGVHRYLDDTGGFVDAREPALCSTMLTAAASTGQRDVVEALIERGASVDLSDGIGWTPLISASFKGSEEVVGVLITAGANVDLQDAAGLSALMVASVAGSASIVRLLLRAGATRDLHGPSGQTALAMAERRGHSHLQVAMLLKVRRSPPGFSAALGPRRVTPDQKVLDEAAVAAAAEAAAAALLATELEECELEESKRLRKQAKNARKRELRKKTPPTSASNSGVFSSTDGPAAWAVAEVVASRAAEEAAEDAAEDAAAAEEAAEEAVEEAAATAETEAIAEAEATSSRPSISLQRSSMSQLEMAAEAAATAAAVAVVAAPKADKEELAALALPLVLSAPPAPAPAQSPAGKAAPDAAFAATQIGLADSSPLPPPVAKGTSSGGRVRNSSSVTLRRNSKSVGGATGRSAELEIRAKTTLQPSSKSLSSAQSRLVYGALTTDNDEVPATLLCPITQLMMLDPVVTADGVTYDRSAIEEWFRERSAAGDGSTPRSPMTGKRLEHTTLVPNLCVRSFVREYAEEHAAVLQECADYLDRLKLHDARRAAAR